ncbi:MAG: sodium:solute symporter family protein [Saprospiraceae bacterium]|nr:sodium:solute symporter family protein [Saprospiraceae bacterium]MCB9329165.1 sodium:solute symporter family protein [Lewinellaceae bacterium]
MKILDIIIFAGYLLIILGIGIYFHKKNQNSKDYFIGGNNMGSGHIGLSLVATDVGGFSIGLGGFGFTIGLSGSWMLFTGLIGAWLSAVLLIPKVINVAHKNHMLTFPQLLKLIYGSRVARIAGIISFIGYVGFSSSQILAGVKLATGTFNNLDHLQVLLILGIVAISYTVFGGIKAVIYTDTFQWILLMIGLIFIAIPMSYFALGGYEEIFSILPDKFFSLNNITWIQFANWLITIVPIWFVGMTIYQRIFACRDEKTAKKAWFIAGLFEYPIMAFMGVTLGLFARVAAEKGMFLDMGFASANGMDGEMGLPLLLSHVLPTGFLGITLAAYFSAIMSTADSCLIAASGNLMTDIFGIDSHHKKGIRYSQYSTLTVGILTMLLAAFMTNVLDVMLMSYAFMVSGLLVPVLAMLWVKKPSSEAALWSMITGGTTTLLLIFFKIPIPFGFDPILLGILSSLIVFILLSKIRQN